LMLRTIFVRIRMRLTKTSVSGLWEKLLQNDRLISEDQGPDPVPAIRIRPTRSGCDRIRTCNIGFTKFPR
jgi:hypothetical protein